MSGTIDKTQQGLEVTIDAALAATIGTAIGASVAADIAAVKAVADANAVKLGAGTDGGVAAGVAGSVQAHVHDVQTQIGAATDASTADGVAGSLHAKFRLIYAAIITTIGGLIGASDAAIGTLAGAGESVFARLRFGFTTLLGVTRRERIQFGAATVTKTDATTHLAIPSAILASATEKPGYLAPYAGVLSGLFVRMSDDSTTDSVFTVQINDVDSALTCTVVGAGAVYAASDLVNTVAVAAGDKVGLELVLGAEPAANHTDVLAAVIFDRT